MNAMNVKNSIFMNINQLNVIQYVYTSQTQFNEIKKIKFCTFTLIC
jgi:hypothetical protein